VHCPNAYLLSLTVRAFSIRFTAQHIRFSVFRHWSDSLALPAKHLLCPLLTSPMRSESIARLSVPYGTHERPPGVRHRALSCVNAGFIKHTQITDGGLHGHVPTRPGCTTPQIRFLYVAPHFWIGLPPDPTSR